MLDYACVIGITTLICSLLSLIGSILVLLSYLVARTRAASQTAQLILHLAASDFFWFLAACVVSGCWVFNNSHVPIYICAICTPIITFTRLASLLWTCIISFNVWMSVEKRRWFFKQSTLDQSGKSKNSNWLLQRWKYYFIIFIIASPATLLTIIKQYTSNIALGCSAGYEPLGVWYEVLFPEVLPIILGFLFNVYVYLKVRGRISRAAYPQSVRKRRKRIMYHYIIVCILSWVPTVVSYFVEIAQKHSAVLEIIARACLYSSGLMNFLVFGLQDPHLKRSFVVVMYHMGLADCFMLMPEYYDSRESGGYSKDHIRGYSLLKASDIEKSVMFEEATITRNADIAKDKRSVYRNRKLSREDKLALYAERPDLDLKNQVNDTNLEEQKEENVAIQSQQSGQRRIQQQPQSITKNNAPESNELNFTNNNLSLPLLESDGVDKATDANHLATSRRMMSSETSSAENPMHSRSYIESINISHTNKEVLSPDSSLNFSPEAASTHDQRLSDELTNAVQSHPASNASPHLSENGIRTWREAQRDDNSDDSSDDEHDEEDMELSRPIWGTI